MFILHVLPFFVNVGSKAQSEFSAIFASILRSDWSADIPQSNLYYVTWGATQSGERLGSNFGRPLGKLEANDLAEIINKSLVTFGKH